MCHVRVTVEIANPVDRARSVTVDNALIGTGETRTTISRDLALELGLEVLGSRNGNTAAGLSRIDQSHALIRLDDRQSFNDVLISDTYPGVFIGVVTLEAMALGVDPINQRLIDVEQLLL